MRDLHPSYAQVRVAKPVAGMVKKVRRVAMWIPANHTGGMLFLLAAVYFILPERPYVGFARPYQFLIG